MPLSDNAIIETQEQPVVLKKKIVDGLIRIYKSALLNFEASNEGYVKLGSDTLGEKFVGIALEEKNIVASDNPSDGTFEVEVIQAGSQRLVKLTTTSTITIANEGDAVYVDGDDAVDVASGITNTTGGQVGVIRQFISANKAWVQLT